MSESQRNLDDERLLAHRELQFLRAGARLRPERGSRRSYVSQRAQKLEEARRKAEQENSTQREEKA